MIVDINKEIQMDTQRDICISGVTSGEVQRRVRDWEIQIIATTAEKTLKELCEAYFRIDESPVKEDLRNRILMGSSTPQTISLKEKCTIVQTFEASEEDKLDKLEIVPKTASADCTTQEEFSGIQQCEVVEINSDTVEPIQEDEEPKESQTIDMCLVNELRKQLVEKHVYILDASALEKMAWQDIISYLLDMVKSMGYMTIHPPKKPNRKLVCFNCDKKGHIVKKCPDRIKKPRKNASSSASTEETS